MRCRSSFKHIIVLPLLLAIFIASNAFSNASPVDLLAGGYAAGPLHLRLTNAAARIHKLLVESGWQRSERP